MRSGLVPLAAAVIVLAVLPAALRGGQVDLGYGYTEFEVDGSEASGDHKGFSAALHLRFPWDREAPRDHTGPRLGATIQYHHYLEEEFGPVTDLLQGSASLDLSWFQRLGGGFFIEPGVGFGGVLASYEVTGDDSRSDDRIKGGWLLRPGFQLGFMFRDWGIGADVGYGFQGLEYADGVGGTNQELYTGFFVRFGR